MIEGEVAECKEKLMRELENFRIEAQKEQKQKFLDEKRKEYDEKMKIIREIELDKKR